MNYKNILFGLIFTLLIFNSNLVFAENKDIRYYYDNIDKINVDFINTVENLPNLIQKAIRNDRLKIEITTDTENLSLFIEKTKDQTYKVTKEEIEKINVWITGKEETINRILDSQDPMTEINKAIKSKEIEIKTKGFFRSIKYKLAKLFLK
jgi:hypothetical protein